MDGEPVGSTRPRNDPDARRRDGKVDDDVIDRSGFDAKTLSERFTGRERLLERVSASASPAEWMSEVAEHTDRQTDIFLELINRCPFGIYVVDEDLKIVAMNERTQDGAFVNVRPVIGRPFEEAMRILWPEDTAAEVVGRFSDTLRTGEPYHSRDFVQARADTGEVEGYEWELHRIRLPEGRQGVICYYFDSTELREAQRALVDAARRQQLLIDELNHRVKNTLVIVQSLAQQTFGNAAVPDEMRAAFEGRLSALASAHDTLTSAHWERAELSDVVAGAVDACGAKDRVVGGGPCVWLEARTAVTFAMALHELCTNALKYGALSNDTGLVHVEWTLDDEPAPRLRFTWRETGGPPVRVPERRGFGSRMLDRALAGELRAKVQLDFAPEGLVCTIDAANRSLFSAPGVEAG